MEPNTTTNNPAPENAKTAAQAAYDVFKRHSYYVYGAMKYLKEHHDELERETIDELKRAIALNTADPTAAIAYVDLDGEDWAHFYPAKPQQEAVSTNNAIDTFLNNYGHRSSEQDALLERLIFNPVPDYSLVLQGQEDEKPAAASSEADKRIDAFINSHPEGTPPPLVRDEAPAENDDDDYFSRLEREASQPSVVAPTEPEVAPQRAHPTAVEPDHEATPTHPALAESLAKIYIKQHRYQRAYEIISNLSLKYPEKSIYFADQLRFLKKLIIIENFNSKK